MISVALSILGRTLTEVDYSRSKWSSVRGKITGSNLREFIATSRKLRYAGMYRGFSTSSRSEVTVVDNVSEEKTWALVAVSSPVKVCEVPQTEHFSNAQRLLNNYKNKINKASRKVQETFTLYNIADCYRQLDAIIITAKSSPKNTRCRIPIYSLMENPCYLLITYSSLKKRNAGGADDIPIGNVTLASLISLGNDLRNKSYKPIPVKRVFIPKGNGKMRPLGIASSRDKIIQQGLNVILTELFDPTFLKSSHGFRKGFSCHSSLKDIYLRWRKVKWFIEADLVQCFDRINHPILLSIISTRLDDYWTSRLLHSILKGGYVHFGGLCDSELSLKIGTPQGSILSPLLCNILLNELDHYVKLLSDEMFVPRQEIISQAYRNSRYNISGTPWEDIIDSIKTMTGNRLSSRKIRALMTKIRKEDTQGKNIGYYEEDLLHRKLLYTRYADDFLLALVGPKELAYKILCLLSNFVGARLGMTFNLDKSGVKHHEKGVMFLGYHIWGKYGLNQKYTAGKGQRIGDVILKFSIPLHKLFVRYAERGFFQIGKDTKNTRYVGRRQDKWLFLETDYEVINRFNTVVRGISNYYSASSQKGILDRFWEVMNRSAALTIAHRHKKRSAKWAYDKFGKELMVKHPKNDKKIISLLRPGSSPVKFSAQNLCSITPILQGPPLPITLTAVCSASELDCSVPNCTLKASAWHHIRHRKRIKGPANHKKVNAYFAKQIPLCKSHHNLVHSGKYDGPSLRKMPGYTPSDFDI